MQKVAESLRGSEAQSTFTYVSDLLLHWTIDNHLTIRFYSLTENSVVIKTVIGGPVYRPQCEPISKLEFSNLRGG